MEILKLNSPILIFILGKHLVENGFLAGLVIMCSMNKLQTDQINNHKKKK